jgi:ribosomal-protein-alanine N-acetyltransferase
MNEHITEQEGQWPFPQPVLETERLILRPLGLADAKELQSMAGDISVADTTVNIPHPYSDGLAEDWISTHPANYAKQESIAYAITLRQGGMLIGVVGLLLIMRFKRAELGYWIGKQFWNQGYATEAGRAMVEFGFGKLGLHKIEANHLRRNPGSGRVMEKIGFEREGILRDHVIKWDRFEDVVTYGLISARDSAISPTTK